MHKLFSQMHFRPFQLSDAYQGLFDHRLGVRPTGEKQSRLHKWRRSLVQIFADKEFSRGHSQFRKAGLVQIIDSCEKTNQLAAPESERRNTRHIGSRILGIARL